MRCVLCSPPGSALSYREQRRGVHPGVMLLRTPTPCNARSHMHYMASSCLLHVAWCHRHDLFKLRPDASRVSLFDGLVDRRVLRQLLELM